MFLSRHLTRQVCTTGQRNFSKTAKSSQTAASIWPSFLTQAKGGAVDVITAESNDIMFNLATEEYIFEHIEVVNPILFLWRNSPTIIMGKH